MDELKRKLTSRKFLLTLGAILTAVGGYLSGSIPFDQMVTLIVGAVGMYAIGEGVADSGNRA